MQTFEKRNPKPAVHEQSRGDAMRPEQAQTEAENAELIAKVAKRIAPMSGGKPLVEEPVKTPIAEPSP
jgi:hypothetical protein